MNEFGSIGPVGDSIATVMERGDDAILETPESDVLQERRNPTHVSTSSARSGRMLRARLVNDFAAVPGAILDGLRDNGVFQATCDMGNRAFDGTVSGVRAVARETKDVLNSPEAASVYNQTLSGVSAVVGTLASPAAFVMNRVLDVVGQSETFERLAEKSNEFLGVAFEVSGRIEEAWGVASSRAHEVRVAVDNALSELLFRLHGFSPDDL